MEEGTEMLAPPVVAQLRDEGGNPMNRSLSADIREERKDLREAAEQTLNVIMDMGFDGTIRWVSPSWADVIGTSTESVQSKPIKELLVGEDKEIFTEAVESMKKDDSRSQIIRFTVALGPASKLAGREDPTEGEGVAEEPQQPATIDLEGQGIMIYDRSSGGASHVSLQACSQCSLLTCDLDYVDDPTMDSTSRDSNRPSRCDR
jgi:serine/threonine-protein kinase RIM15